MHVCEHPGLWRRVLKIKTNGKKSQVIGGCVLHFFNKHLSDENLVHRILNKTKSKKNKIVQLFSVFVFLVSCCLLPSFLARSLMNGFPLQSLGQGHRELTLPPMAWLAPKWGRPREIRTSKRSQVSFLIEIPYMYGRIFTLIRVAEFSRDFEETGRMFSPMWVSNPLFHLKIQPYHPDRLSNPSHNWVP